MKNGYNNLRRIHPLYEWLNWKRRWFWCRVLTSMLRFRTIKNWLLQGFWYEFVLWNAITNFTTSFTCWLNYKVWISVGLASQFIESILFREFKHHDLKRVCVCMCVKLTWFIMCDCIYSVSEIQRAQPISSIPLMQHDHRHTYSHQKQREMTNQSGA